MRTANWPLVTGESACEILAVKRVYSTSETHVAIWAVSLVDCWRRPRCLAGSADRCRVFIRAATDVPRRIDVAAAPVRRGKIVFGITTRGACPRWACLRIAAHDDPVSQLKGFAQACQRRPRNGPTRNVKLDSRRLRLVLRRGRSLLRCHRQGESPPDGTAASLEASLSAGSAA